MAPATKAAETAAAPIEIWLSSDGKHTVKANATADNAEEVLELAKTVYDAIVAEYGLKPQPASRFGGGKAKAAPAVEEEKVDPFCADCGAEIKGFTDRSGKTVSAQTIAAARKRNLGRVTCGKTGCKSSDF